MKVNISSNRVFMITLVSEVFLEYETNGINI